MGISKRTWSAAAMSIAAAVAMASGAALAGTDGDGVPDGSDNCVLTPNGPSELSNQVDTDLDGWGNACDTDYTGDGLSTTLDYAGLFNQIMMGEGPLSGPDLVYDHDGDEHFTLGDLAIFEQIFRGVRPLGQ